MKKKKIIIGIVGVFVLAFGAGGAYLYAENDPGLKSQTISYEYGKVIELEPSDLINTNKKEILDSVDIDLSTLTMEKGKDYPKVGEYTIGFTYKTMFKEKSGKIKINVEDTEKPEINNKQEQIEVNFGESNHDFNQYFEISDLSETTVEIDTSQVDFNTAGEYTASICATDAHDNETKKEFKVIVKEQQTVSQSQPKDESKPEEETPSQSAPGQSVPASGPSYVKGIMIVNKKHPLPSNYAPGEDPTAGAKIRQLIADMQAQGYSVSSSYSGYRSYTYQNNLYWNYVNSYGQASADTFSARAGYSEHQTGLAFDLIHTNGSLVQTSPEVDWIANNAHKYGFIVRYQSGKEGITGYMAEPWHLRYIGDEATSIYQSGLTLEEYLGVPGGSY